MPPVAPSWPPPAAPAYGEPPPGPPILSLPLQLDVPSPGVGATPMSRYYDPFTRQFAYGNAGIQPYKFGWYSYDDMTWIPTSAARGTTGSFQDLEWNSYLRYSRPINDTLIFTWTPTWDAGFWTGPTGVALPPVVNLISSDIQLSSASDGPFNFQVGFTPQVNSDLMRQLDSNAYMFDGRLVLFYQSSPNLRWAFGFAYWNRVIDQFIPYGGIIWAPNDRWEFRLMFPKARISRYCGDTPGGPYWVYATAEYNAQAWQIDMQNAAGTKTRGEMRDYRIMIGIDTQQSFCSLFAECGVVFDRQFIFRDASFNFDVAPSMIARVGVTF